MTIRSYLGAIQEDIQDGNAQRALTDLQRVRAAADKMARMLADLLELSRVGRVEHNIVDVSVDEVVREACELLASQINASRVQIAVYAVSTRLLERYAILFAPGH